MSDTPRSNDQDDIRTLQSIAVERAKSTKDISDVEKAVSILKTVADHEKIAHDNESHAKTLRFEWYKTASAAIVPLLTLLTLAFTLWIQGAQLRLSQEANADAAWRDTSQKVLTQLRSERSTQARRDVGGQASSEPDPQLAVQLLHPYFSDPRHGTEAIDLAMLVLTRVADERVASTFFASPEINVTGANLTTFLNRSREIWDTIDFYANEDPRLPIQEASRRRQALFTTSRLVCDKIANALRQTDFPVFDEHVLSVFRWRHLVWRPSTSYGGAVSTTRENAL